MTHTFKRCSFAAVALVAAVAVGGCAQSHSRIAVVRVTEVEQNWPEFQNYYNQLQAHDQAISQSRISAADKRKQLAQFQAQEKTWNEKVTSEVRAAVTDIAKQKNYQMVVTREGTAYGGDDITTDVEKALKITPPSPTPK
ncbi:MAG TPA: OmpH family outer membrane protein [Candidatus Eremiobacteraceae bacterium]|nr:OmpH family outer membrane protein [Candidatus Eremiobacteraceae bacterium]